MKNKTSDLKIARPSDGVDAGGAAYLPALGERVRRLRAIRGMTRKELAQAAAVSERHLANLERGIGNVSILVLRQIARAFHCPLAELVGDVTTSSPEWLLIRGLLENRSTNELELAWETLSGLFGDTGATGPRNRLHQIALIGLRGAGKSTLGRLLAADIGYPFVELSAEIERVAGGGILEIHSLYGAAGYRRYEKRALDEALHRYPQMVLATPGGLVSEPATMNALLSHCYTVWVKATPEDHMARVMAQGDFRPMAGNNEAMSDLKQILAGREAFYSKADLVCPTSGQSLTECFDNLRSQLRQALDLPL